MLIYYHLDLSNIVFLATGTCNVCGTKEDILVTAPSTLLAAAVHWCELTSLSLAGWPLCGLFTSIHNIENVNKEKFIMFNNVICAIIMCVEFHVKECRNFHK